MISFSIVAAFAAAPADYMFEEPVRRWFECGAEGGVSLQGATIKGSVDCGGSQFINP